MRIIRGNLCTPSWRHNVYGEVSVCRNSSLCRYVPMNSASSEMGTFPHVLLPQKWGNSCTMVGPTICADISPLAVGAGIRGDFLMYFATSKMGKYPHNVWFYHLCGYFPMSWETGKFPRVLCYLRNGEISAQCLFVRIFLHAQCQPSDGEISSATTHLNTGEISAHSILLPKHCGHEIFLPALVSIPRYFCITISYIWNQP